MNEECTYCEGLELITIDLRYLLDLMTKVPKSKPSMVMLVADKIDHMRLALEVHRHLHLIRGIGMRAH